MLFLTCSSNTRGKWGGGLEGTNKKSAVLHRVTAFKIKMGLFSVYPMHVSEAAMCTGEQGSRPELTLATCLQLNWFSSSQNLQLEIHPRFYQVVVETSFQFFQMCGSVSPSPVFCSLDSVALPADLWSRLYSSYYILYLVGDILGQNKAVFFSFGHFVVIS